MAIYCVRKGVHTILELLADFLKGLDYLSHEILNAKLKAYAYILNSLQKQSSGVVL